ncbi:MAG TPA: glycosyltransferase family 2 protein [Phototrophicaceae bacterium]|nr:glycosyltransferase family 2 protein [Phototrophicaceae bacterium]
MYHNSSVAVVVPCHNEELLITRVLDTMPDYVDRIYIVDDCSTDRTASVVADYIGSTGTTRVQFIQHQLNQGVGGAIVTGYKQALQDNMDVVAVMAGDAQMDPDDLPLIIGPVTDGAVDYTKGNRLVTGEAWNQIPRVRYLGNVLLSLMTKIASGYWHIFDSQTGYTAISRKALQTLDLDGLWKRYGYPNHLLIMLNIHNFAVRDVPVKPVYNIGEKSGIRIWRVIPTISLLLLRGFIQRLFQKFIVRDSHPLVLFYFFGGLTFFPGLLFGLYLFFYRLLVGPVAPTTALFPMFLIMFGLNFLMFAMWFDMDYNRHLR